MATENGVSHYDDSAQFSEEEIQSCLANVPESRRKVVGLSVSKAFNHWCKITEEKLNIIMKSQDGLYDFATLTENLEERLNKEKETTDTAQFGGVGITLGTACYLYNKSLHIALQLLHEDVEEILCDELMKVHVGYAMETYWKACQTCPSEEEYRLMVIKKHFCIRSAGVSTPSDQMQKCSEIKQIQNFTNKLTECALRLKADFLPLLEDLSFYIEIQACYINLLSSIKNMLHLTIRRGNRVRAD